MPQANVILLYLLVINALTMLIYASDKHFSRNGMFRVSEKMLLLLAFFGGSPAAFISMKLFRHKTKKGTFRARFWFIVIIQIAALAYYLHQGGHL